MNNIVKMILSGVFIFFVSTAATAEDDHHEHDEKKVAHGHDEHDEDTHKEGDHSDGYSPEAKHEEAPSNVGPDKGILEANTKDGMKLSEKAIKSFEIKTVAYLGGTITLPRSAIFFGLQEKNVYRVRNGFFKRIDFTTQSKNKSEFKITSSELATGDQIVTSGLGFLRIAELAATGGAVHGHSH